MTDKVVVDCATGKAKTVALTTAERSQRNKDAERAEAQERATAEAKQRRDQARASGHTKLKDLGLDEEEIAALGLAES